MSGTDLRSSVEQHGQLARSAFDELFAQAEAGQRLPVPLAELRCSGCRAKLSEVVRSSKGPLLVEDGTPANRRLVEAIEHFRHRPMNGDEFHWNVVPLRPRLDLLSFETLDDAVHPPLKLRCAKHRLKAVAITWLLRALRAVDTSMCAVVMMPTE